MFSYPVQAHGMYWVTHYDGLAVWHFFRLLVIGAVTVLYGIAYMEDLENRTVPAQVSPGEPTTYGNNAVEVSVREWDTNFYLDTLFG